MISHKNKAITIYSNFSKDYNNLKYSVFVNHKLQQIKLIGSSNLTTYLPFYYQGFNIRIT